MKDSICASVMPAPWRVTNNAHCHRHQGAVPVEGRAQVVGQHLVGHCSAHLLDGFQVVTARPTHLAPCPSFANWVACAKIGLPVSIQMQSA